ncbi:MAG TPA: hypothetical protein VN963_08405, partial [bacterium]|nr:hypothetical protein [bacterium]
MGAKKRIIYFIPPSFLTQAESNPHIQPIEDVRLTRAKNSGRYGFLKTFVLSLLLFGTFVLRSQAATAFVTSQAGSVSVFSTDGVPEDDGNDNAWNEAGYNAATSSSAWAAAVTTCTGGGWTSPCSITG